MWPGAGSHGHTLSDRRPSERLGAAVRRTRYATVLDVLEGLEGHRSGCACVVGARWPWSIETFHAGGRGPGACFATRSRATVRSAFGAARSSPAS